MPLESTGTTDFDEAAFPDAIRFWMKVVDAEPPKPVRIIVTAGALEEIDLALDQYGPRRNIQEASRLDRGGSERQIRQKTAFPQTICRPNPPDAKAADRTDAWGKEFGSAGGSKKRSLNRARQPMH